ncbi:hypothetical protein Tco_1006073 [Tanacetum coccineum]|uniref:Uncharacterized protein n=1 Tax=Tanacetum coccineum TaxID=301880 RepID=A0ABQ5FGS8_9ASTR
MLRHIMTGDNGEYGKPGRVKLSVTFDALNRISRNTQSIVVYFLETWIRDHIGWQIPNPEEGGPEARNKLWDEITEKGVNARGVGREWTYKRNFDLYKQTSTNERSLLLESQLDAARREPVEEKNYKSDIPANVIVKGKWFLPVEIIQINSSADEEGGTTVVGCDQNDASIRKEMQKSKSPIRCSRSAKQRGRQVTPTLASMSLIIRKSLVSTPVPDAYEYPATVVVCDVHGAGTRVHIPAQCGSEAHNGPHDSILSHEPNPLGKHRPPPLQ